MAKTKTPDLVAVRYRPYRPPSAGRRLATCFLLMDTVIMRYRSRDPLESHFAWVNSPAAAARFPSRAVCLRVGRDYEAGIDSVSDHDQGCSPNPEYVYYPPMVAEGTRKQRSDAEDDS